MLEACGRRRPVTARGASSSAPTSLAAARRVRAHPDLAGPRRPAVHDLLADAGQGQADRARALRLRARHPPRHRPSRRAAHRGPRRSRAAGQADLHHGVRHLPLARLLPRRSPAMRPVPTSRSADSTSASGALWTTSASRTLDELAGPRPRRRRLPGDVPPRGHPSGQRCVGAASPRRSDGRRWPATASCCSARPPARCRSRGPTSRSTSTSRTPRASSTSGEPWSATATPSRSSTRRSAGTASTPDSERALAQAFVDWLRGIRDRAAAEGRTVLAYHYTSYEIEALNRILGADEIADVMDLFVDLYGDRRRALLRRRRPRPQEGRSGVRVRLARRGAQRSALAAVVPRRRPDRRPGEGSRSQGAPARLQRGRRARDARRERRDDRIVKDDEEVQLDWPTLQSANARPLLEHPFARFADREVCSRTKRRSRWWLMRT